MRGFTLIELMVGIAVMAMLALMSWQGLDGMMRVQTYNRERGDAVQTLQTTLAQWGADLDATVEVLRPLGEAVGLTFGEPAEAADENAFAITTTLQDELGGVTTLSELAEACSDGSLVLGGTPECPTRPFCQPGLEETYGFTFAQVNDYDLGAPTNQALIQGEISLALALSTDPVFAQ